MLFGKETEFFVFSKVLYFIFLCTPSPDLSSLGPLLYVCGWHEWKSDLVFMGILSHEGSLWVLIDIMKKAGYEDILNDEESAD